MESGNTFNFIDGFNLNFVELKFRLFKMGVEIKDHITDYGYFANLYNNIMNSKDILFISRIKNILEQDKERSNFSDLLSKKRARDTNSERKDNNSFMDPYKRVFYSSDNFKNG
jgi:hypothetical protein